MSSRNRSHSFIIFIIFIAVAAAVVWAGVTFLPKAVPAAEVRTMEQEVSVIPDGAIVTDILLPVTDFEDGRQNITSAELANYDLVSINSLTPEQKVLSIDGNYFFDDFEHGAIYKVVTFESDDRAAAEKAKNEYNAPSLPTKDTVLSFNQTGTTALSRMMIKKLNAVGDGAFFAEYIKDFLSATDLTHISNEVSFASDCSVNADMTLCSDLRMYDTIKAIGTDIVELTGNHNNDWGASANISTIEKYHADGISTFGGGINEKEAAEPLEISEKGTNITLIGINHSTSSKENGQGASGSHPGANIYDEATVVSQIKAAKEKGDFIIVDVQYSECYCYPDYGEEMPECDDPISGQAEFFRHLVTLGADMVVGTQAHQPQTYEIYKGVPIYYGLGNLFFDQTYWPGTTRGLILTHYFYKGKLLQTRISPTVYDTNYQTRLMDTASAEAFLKRLQS